MYVAVQFLLNARLVYQPLGSVGQPATLMGLGLFGWWVGTRALRPQVIRGRQPLHVVVALYLLVFLVAFTLGLDRGLPGVEASGMNRSVISVLSIVGVLLVAADGLRTRADVDLLLNRVVLGACFSALVGSAQFFFGYDLAARMSVPGLSLHRQVVGIDSRGGPGFNRVAGTAGHYIEFGVVLAMLLPIAIHYALHAEDDRQRRRRGVAVALLAVASSFSISRSGTLALFVALVALAAAWSGPMLAKAAVWGAIGVVGMRSAIPGLLGTIRSLFTNLGSDPSVQNRTADYDPLFAFVRERPWFGRGPGTFSPEDYILLDNQYLGTLVETGYVGLVALLLLLLTGFLLARRVAVHARADSTRHLGQALAATILSAILVSFTFDSLGFSTFRGQLFLIIGIAGALWRIDRAAGADAAGGTPPNRPVLRRSRRVVPLPSWWSTVVEGRAPGREVAS